MNILLFVQTWLAIRFIYHLPDTLFENDTKRLMDLLTTCHSITNHNLYQRTNLDTQRFAYSKQVFAFLPISEVNNCKRPI